MEVLALIGIILLIGLLFVGGGLFGWLLKGIGSILEFLFQGWGSCLRVIFGFILIIIAILALFG